MAGSFGAKTWEHSSVAVTDVDEAIKFYRDAFGYEVTWEGRGWTDLISRYVGLPGIRADIVMMRSPISSHTLEFIAFKNIPPGEQDRGPTRPGAAHICFKVENLERALEEAKRLGAEVIGEVAETPGVGRGCYCREPSGSVFELTQRFAG